MEYFATLSEPGVASLLLAFSMGIGTSFTPCVYPLIPITLAVFGAGEETSRARSFFIAASYVLGMSTTYTALGLFAASTGAVFGAFLGSTPVILIIATLLCAMAMLILDIVDIPFLHRIQSQANSLGGKKKGALGAYLMGTLSGVVAAPCVGPVLVAILAVAASSENTVWGGVLLLTYSLGLGLLFLVLGTFSGVFHRLPRSGNWMYGVKFVLSSALLFLALYFLQPLLPDAFVPVDSIGIRHGILGLFFLSAVLSAFLAFRHNHSALKIVASLLVSIVLYDSLLARRPSSTPDSIVWHTSLATATEASLKSNRPIFVDLSADWCAACKELEKLTFPDSRVQNALTDFVPVKIDFTTPDPEITQRFGVVGLPLLLFLDTNGNEIPDSRLQEFVDANTFLKHLEKVLQQKIVSNP
jgi:thiol:disulfide interchange protein DsbD